MRAAGTPVSALYPTSPPVYRSMGWEHAGVTVGVELPTAALAAVRGAHPLVGDALAPAVLRPIEATDVDTVHALYSKVAGAAVGPLTRTGPFFDPALLTTLDGVLLAERDGAPVGYVSYSRGDSRLAVHDLIGTDVGALGALLRAAGSWHTVAPTVSVRLGDPALLALVTPVPLPMRWQETWMLRVVDAAAAVAGRGWPAAVTATVDLDLVDGQAPWQHGRWRLRVERGSGTLEPGGNGDVRLHIRGFSALFTGFATTVALRTAGLLDGDAAASAALDAAFAGPSPWMVDYF
jgi:predicted acetyltransferase